MLLMLHHQHGLLFMKGIWTRNIHGIKRITFRHFFGP
ncbi:hypothetical protein CGLO_17284 [Colletotrichum gloeosporioides Cg-14]|uniref:Uncharacterized protein n=1 Tax=Colletotrichum gloeosporioides (strain Cg-14) TaxID=1237896 RepID=T0JX21_COLGC|nr:hypothetical protein CGLO_17284 [Colletotrichum gloeosporioides Cg-14]